MPVDLMFWFATAAFAWGLSLASYRWFAIHNNWPMGEWQAHRPGLAIAIGLFSVLFAALFAYVRGGTTVVVLPLFGTACALLWTALTRVGAQSALLFAPLAVIGLLVMWIMAASTVVLGDAGRTVTFEADTRYRALPAATDREGSGTDRDHGISFDKSPPAAEPQLPAPIRR